MIAFRIQSLFAQVAALLLVALILSQAVSVAIVMSLPQPRPGQISVSALATLLRAPDPAQASEGLYALDVRPTMPPRGDTVRMAPVVEAKLAARLGVPVGQVRVHASRLMGDRLPGAGDDPVLLGNVVAGWFDGRLWHVLHSTEEPSQLAWRLRMVLWFVGSALLLLPLCWFYARGLGGTLRRFAAAADRMGGGAAEPEFPLEGARELRLAGAALNQMHSRIAQYVSERTAMIGAIAHDLRTPLARISFAMEEAETGLREQVQGDVEQMRMMIADTLAFVKGASISARSEAIDLGRLLASVARKYTLLDADVMVDAPPGVTMVGDPLSLERLMANLIDNAIRYGTLARIALSVEAGQARIAVADDGPGLPEDQLAQVLHPFVRADVSRNAESGGIGLGLAIARAIARNHGGELTLHNGSGQFGASCGLVAVCTLPVS